MALEEYRQREMAKGLNQWQSLAQENTLGAKAKQLTKKLFLSDATVEITAKQAEAKMGKQPHSANYKRKADDFLQVRKDLKRVQAKEEKALAEEEGFQYTFTNFQETLAKDPDDRSAVETQMMATGITTEQLAERVDEQEVIRQKLTETRRKMEKNLSEVTLENSLLLVANP